MEFSAFGESDDKDFWNRYNRIPGDARDERGPNGDFCSDYYVDPLSKTLKPADHPHRSPSTFRKRTFDRSWHAGEHRIEDGVEEWKLAPTFAAIFEAKVLRKAGLTTRVPTLDLAVWLFFGEQFEGNAIAGDTEKLFRERFPFSDEDYARLFVMRSEDAAELFTTEKPSDEDYAAAIKGAVVPARVDIQPAVHEEPGEGLNDDDVVLVQVKELLGLGSSGIILEGCPGTGKTWYARRIAEHLVDDPKKCIFSVQFHPSFGYEDFVEGYKPADDTKSGFATVDKVFLDACGQAKAGLTVVIVDEINRGDPARVFGELLTYIEADYRGLEFTLPYSGKSASIPTNLLIIGTMNPFDRSIAQLDQALMRRFDHIELRPSAETVAAFLQSSEQFGSEQIDLVTEWFEVLQELVPHGVGHTYFKDVKTPEHLRTVWRFRVLPYCVAALELEEQKLGHVRNSFEATYRRIIGQETEAAEP